MRWEFVPVDKESVCLLCVAARILTPHRSFQDLRSLRRFDGERDEMTMQ
jgi:hypothetical protein